MNEGVLRELLSALSAAFATRDTEGLLRLFSSTASVTYAGSERGEKATGPDGLRRLFSDLLARPTAYCFELADITFGDLAFGEHTVDAGLVWVLADGDGTETAGDGATDTFAYRLTGVLAQEGAQWRWRVLAGSEPTAPDGQRHD